ncbi:hypothetical protein D3C80_1988990 [compost metagenome]
MSIPSPRGIPTEFTVIPRIITFSQYIGTIFQNAVFSNDTPSMNTFLQLIGEINIGGRTGLPFSPS